MLLCLRRKKLQCAFNKNVLANFLPQDTIFCLIEMKFVAGKLIIKQELTAFASTWLPPWPVRRACKSMRVSLFERKNREGIVIPGNVVGWKELSCCDGI